MTGRVGLVSPEPVDLVSGLDQRRRQLAGLFAGQFFTVDGDRPLDGAVAMLDADGQLLAPLPMMTAWWRPLRVTISMKSLNGHGS
jgi:hypothetical protein